MKRLKIVAAILSLLILAGCAAPIITPPTAAQLEILEQDQGWVQVKVTGVPSTGYRILWGDATSSYGISDVAPWEGLYEHFYQAVLGGASGRQIPTEYEIVLANEKGQVVAQESILIASVVCHLELVSIEDREVTVKYWGRFGIDYSISWGDSSADHLEVSTQSASDTATHTYSSPGTYALGMEEIWAPMRIFFTITVE